MKILLIIFLINPFILGCEKDNVKPKAENYTKKTIRYKKIEGVNINLLSLDIYYFKGDKTPKPVVIYVHGGGWCIGDKANKITNKTDLFSKQEYIFVSINYRLSPYPYRLSDENRIKFPIHNIDVADAVKWVYTIIRDYGGNPEKIALLGHSAGAHLVSLTGTNDTFLKNSGVPLSAIKGIASIDTKRYDIYARVHDPLTQELYTNVFGSDSLQNIEASPIYNIKEGRLYPRFFIALRGNYERKAASYRFIDKLKKNGVDVSSVDGQNYTHKEINEAIGNKNDTIITPALIGFFNECFKLLDVRQHPRPWSNL